MWSRSPRTFFTPDRSSVVITGFVLSVLFITNADLRAQDSNYWRRVFGLPSQLITGPRIAGPGSSSSLVNNPGSLPLGGAGQVGLSGDVVSRSFTTYKNALGVGQDLVSDSSFVLPTLTAFTARADAPIHVVGGIAAVTVQDYKADIGGSFILGPGNPILPPEASTLAFELNRRSDVGESWFGAGMGYQIIKGLGVGASTFIAYRREEMERRFAVSGLDLAGEPILSDGTLEASWYNLLLLLRTGVAYSMDRARLGATLTVPGLPLAGTGRVSGVLRRVNADVNGVGGLDDILFQLRQDDLEATYKTPWQIGGGFEYDFKEGFTASVSTEWFSAIGDYTVIEPTKAPAVFPPGTVAPDDLLRVRNGARSVTNVSAGVDITVNEGLRVLGGFRTDYSWKRPGIGDELSTTVTSWDLYHFGGGVVLSRSIFDVALGLGFATAGQDASKLLPPSLGGQLIPSANVQYTEFDLFFGIDIHLQPPSSGP